MKIALFAILGGLIGWALTVLLPVSTRRMTVVTGAMTGVAGALLSGWALVTFFHASSAQEHGIAGIASLVAIFGAAVSCGLVSLASGRVSR